MGDRGKRQCSCEPRWVGGIWVGREVNEGCFRGRLGGIEEMQGPCLPESREPGGAKRADNKPQDSLEDGPRTPGLASVPCWLNEGSHQRVGR